MLNLVSVLSFTTQPKSTISFQPLTDATNMHCRWDLLSADLSRLEAIQTCHYPSVFHSHLILDSWQSSSTLTWPYCSIGALPPAGTCQNRPAISSHRCPSLGGPWEERQQETTSFSFIFFFPQLTCDSNFESIKFSLTAEPLTLYIHGMESDL